ncbi:hypothetical protein ACN47E_007014 [Coniothyrium glycines]
MGGISIASVLDPILDVLLFTNIQSRCTWEPAENMQDASILQDWEAKKSRMGPTACQDYIQKNIAEVDEAFLRDDIRKEIRAAKREKRRARSKKRPRATKDMSESDSEDSLPLISRKRATTLNESSQFKSLAAREALDSSQLNSLFIDEDEPFSPGLVPQNDVPIRSPLQETSLVPRRPPLQQSDSSEGGETMEEGEIGTSGDSSQSEIAPWTEKSNSKSACAKSPRKEDQAQDVEMHGAGSALTTNSATVTPKPSVPSQGEKQAERVKASSATQDGIASIVSRKPRQQQSNEARRQSQSGPSSHPSVTTQNKHQPQKVMQRPALGTVGRDKVAKISTTAPAMAKRTQPGAMPPNTMSIVNKEDTQRRRQWANSGGHYSTLKFRRNAELRSRVEGNPDIGALEFVGAAPTGLAKSKMQRRDDNPYGRRDITNSRVSEEASSSNARGDPIQETPLADWELDKAPLICPQWRLSNNCEYGPQRCRMMHRDRDANGRSYPLGDVHGYIPPKYRKPPITCPYWLEDKNGCSKTASECNFAHKNTGLKPHPETWRDAPIPIDPNQAPISESTVGRPTAGQPKQTTCAFWQRGHCRFDADSCAYAHWDTGVTAPDPAKEHTKSSAAQEHTNKERVAGQQYTCWYWKKRGDCRFGSGTCGYEHWDTGVMAPQKTCFYWSQSRCNKTANQCKFLHWDTGTITDPPANAQTCRSWTKGSCYETNCKFRHTHTGILSNPTQDELRRAAINPEMQSLG